MSGIFTALYFIRLTSFPILFRPPTLFTITVVVSKCSLRASQYLQTVLLFSTVYSTVLLFFFYFIFSIFCFYGSDLLACSGPELISLKYESFRGFVELFGREGPASRYVCTYTRKCKEIKTWIHFHSPSGTRFHDPSVWLIEDNACPRLSGQSNWRLFHPSQVVLVCYITHNPSLHRSHWPIIPTCAIVLVQSFERKLTAVTSLLQNMWTHALPVFWCILRSCSFN